MAYNTKDGFIGPHTQMAHLTITNSMSYGNSGQQWKWVTLPNSTTVFENNLTVGNCNAWSATLPGAWQSFSRTTGNPGAYLTVFCRAASDTFSFGSGANSSVLIANNTTITYGNTVFDLSCGTAGTCGTTPFVFKNNIILGYTTPEGYFPGGNGYMPGLYYLSDTSDSVISSYNFEYGVRNGDCGKGGTGIVCSDPLLIGEPVQGSVPPESSLFNFNFRPSSASPAIGAGAAISGITTDYNGAVRPGNPSIGALEP
jgi:hypothetical protein